MPNHKTGLIVAFNSERGQRYRGVPLLQKLSEFGKTGCRGIKLQAPIPGVYDKDAIRTFSQSFRASKEKDDPSSPIAMRDMKRRDIASALADLIEGDIDDGFTHTTVSLDEENLDQLQLLTSSDRGKGRVPHIVGVTALTAQSETMVRKRFGMSHAELAVRRAREARQTCGIFQLVSAVSDIAGIRDALEEVTPGGRVVFFNPGVRRVCDANDDQAMIATPRMAAEASSDYVIVGRPIMKSSNPVAVMESYLQELKR